MWIERSAGRRPALRSIHISHQPLLYRMATGCIFLIIRYDISVQMDL